jgi:2-keto-4-pentenoate hydratase
LGVATRDVAGAFVAARRSGRALSSYPGEAPGDLAAAYAIQDAALAIWDRPVGGWKVGRINPPDDRRLGANRLAGPVFADTIFDAGSTPIAMPVFEDGFAAVEAEFMLRLAPPSAVALPRDPDEALAWVDQVRIGIEIASSPYEGINRDGPCVTVSDQGNNAGLVLGPAVDRGRWDSLSSIEVIVAIDGQTVGKATTASMLDGPFGAICFLLDNLARRGIEPRPGWWISSGAITGVHETGPGSEVVAKFEDVGHVTSRIEAAS